MVFAGGVIADEVGSPRVDIFDGSNWTNQNMVNGTRAVEACATAGDKILFAEVFNMTFLFITGVPILHLELIFLILKPSLLVIVR